MSKVKEKEIYTIRLLEDSEFDKLPYKGISDSLGFADPETGCAFVRKTGVKDWDMATIQHEIDELLSNKSFDEDADGIRHKKFFKQVAVPILATLAGSMIGAPFLGALGAPLGAAAGSAIQQKVQTGKISALQTGLAGLGGAVAGPGIKAGFASVPKAGLGKIGAGIKGAFFGAPKIAPAGTTLSRAGVPLPSDIVAKGATAPTGAAAISQAFKPTAFTSPQNILGTTGAGLGTMGTLGAFRQPVTTVGAPAVTPPIGLGATPRVAGVGAPAVAPGVTTPTTPGVTPGVTPAAPTGILGKAAEALKDPKTLLGLGTIGAGAIPKTPEFQMPASVSRLEEAFLNQRGLSEVGQVARGELLKTLQTSPEGLFPVADDAFIQASLRGTRESYERAQEQIDANFNLTGTFGSGEHQAEKARLTEELARTESDFIALQNQRRFELAQATKQDAVITALQDAGLTEQHIMDIVALDVQAAAIKYGADVASMSIIKEALAGLGTELLTGGFTPGGGTAIQ